MVGVEELTEYIDEEEIRLIEELVGSYLKYIDVGGMPTGLF